MRFLKNGPPIPDELLIARDEGRVVFFCGAGVSRARAKLLDFFGLADDVLRRLRVSADSPAYKILEEAREINQRTGVAGLISADRIFGLLERDFLVQDVEQAVAEALRPKERVDLSAHRLLLDLARTPEGRIRLVTTNFDRLFSDCDGSLKVLHPPRLPDPASQEEMDGIIHLHGYAKPDYSGSEGDGFILSSSEFGRAYLSDGWATAFIREIMSRYVVVFIGYTADDPPVQYLLEALNKRSGQLDKAYAFQAGLSEEAAARWTHKGVTAIAYPEEDNHRALWETLSAWAERAKDPSGWLASVVEKAKNGPEKLEPHERGQVAHTFSTLEGVRKFSDGNSVPPATWLAVFDPFKRYGNPERKAKPDEIDAPIDPFDLYGLDTDTTPKRRNPDDYYEKREVPQSAWDGLAATRRDRQDLRDEHFPAVRGPLARHFPRLSSRMRQIGIWIAKTAHEPAAIWWAASQTGLHPEIQELVRWELDRSGAEILPDIRVAWRYLFGAWDQSTEDFHRGWYEFRAYAEKEGWSHPTVRRYGAIKRPQIVIKPSYSGRPVAPERGEITDIWDIIRLDVDYPDQTDDLVIPDEWLLPVVRELRRNLESAVQLETETGTRYGLTHISPINPDNGPDISPYQRTHGLSGCLIAFASLFQRLVEHDSSAARQEFAAWPTDDDTIFSRLRIWATGNSMLVPTEAFGSRINEVSDEAFWDIHHRRDLLISLSKRWPQIDSQTRRGIEARILQGRGKWASEDENDFQVRKAWTSLTMIQWLIDNGCDVSAESDAALTALKEIAKDWKPEHAHKAADSLESRGGAVQTDSDPSELLKLPLGELLVKAHELRGRTDNFLQEYDPFQGLSTNFPNRAFAALSLAAKRKEYPDWAWRVFLQAEARNEDSSRLLKLIADRISTYPDDAIAALIRPVTDWTARLSKRLASEHLEVFERIIAKCISALSQNPPDSRSGLVRGTKEPDWVNEAINAPVGKVAEALFAHPARNGLEANAGLPAHWLKFVHGLLSLTGDSRCYALVMFAYDLNWFYVVDPAWTEANLLSVLESGDPSEQGSIWSGFFWRANTPHSELYKRLQPKLIALPAGVNFSRRGYSSELAAMVLAGWSSQTSSGERYISNPEMTHVILNANDEFRSQLLWRIDNMPEPGKLSVHKNQLEMLIEFLRDVWPRQKAVKSATISARLCDLAFSDEENFPALADIVLPLLATVDREYLRIPSLRRTKDSIVDKYPEKVLALLYAVLPENVLAWPYEMNATLQRIGEANGSLKYDERLLELMRRWNSR